MAAREAGEQSVRARGAYPPPETAARAAVTRGELHARFAEALAADPEAAGSTFVFAIEYRPAPPGGCNWYALAPTHRWTGDPLSALRAFARVKGELSRRYALDATTLTDAELAGADAPAEAC